HDHRPAARHEVPSRDERPPRVRRLALHRGRRAGQVRAQEQEAVPRERASGGGEKLGRQQAAEGGHRAWRRSYELVLAVYDATDSFPKNELYGLTSQTRRAGSRSWRTSPRGLRKGVDESSLATWTSPSDRSRRLR